MLNNGIIICATSEAQNQALSSLITEIPKLSQEEEGMSFTKIDEMTFQDRFMLRLNQTQSFDPLEGGTQADFEKIWNQSKLSDYLDNEAVSAVPVENQTNTALSTIDHFFSLFFNIESNSYQTASDKRKAEQVIALARYLTVNTEKEEEEDYFI